MTARYELKPEQIASNKRHIASEAHRNRCVRVSRQIMRETFPHPDPELDLYLTLNGNRTQTSVEDQIRLFCEEYKLRYVPDPLDGHDWFEKDWAHPL